MKKGTTIVGFILSFLAGAILMWGVDKAGGGHTEATLGSDSAASKGMAQANPGAVKVELFVMSQCPYGVQAENGFKEVVEKLGGDVDFRVEFIGDKTPDGNLTSMHGPNEVKGNLAQVCAMKHSNKWFDFLMCQNQNMKEVHTNWESCAAQAGVPVDKLKACMEGEEGKQLLAASFDLAKQKGARGSPTIYIGGTQYQGGRRSADYFRAICNAYQGNKPAACSNIPESPKVNVTLLGDKRCAECDTKRLEGQLRSRVANPVVTNLDYADAAGKKLFDQIKPAMLPVAIFDATLDADKEAAQALSRGIKQSGDYKVLSMGGNWNPACADEGGCELGECQKTLQCRKDEPGHLEVFVMSQCPFGVKGMDAMKEVLDNFKKAGSKIDFEIHYIGDGDAKTGLKAMHGQGEVDENIRELCAINHYPKDYKYMDYIWCRNKDYKSTQWESCTGGDTGIDTEVIKKCFEGDEGKQLLEASYAYSKSLGFGASPTWLANGKKKFSGVDAESIKNNFCQHNKLAGCENKLSGPPPQQGGAQPAGCGQ
jgi:predicted DsbA family dithiol-disulfide isomerase